VAGIRRTVVSASSEARCVSSHQDQEARLQAMVLLGSRSDRSHPRHFNRQWMREQERLAHYYDPDFTSDNNHAASNDHYGCVHGDNCSHDFDNCAGRTGHIVR
jgi:hypothetical protein